MKKFKISVIIPIYNVEEYLEETILSVVNQTIGFENIQMILVNDGSPDNSEEICLKYKELYPDNVVYINQKNAGVSAARNNGIKHATGEFINFLDSDDKFSLNAYKVGYEMLKKNNLDVVCYRVFYFDAKNEPLYIDYKFDGTDKVVDLTVEPFYPLYHITSALFRNDLVRGVEFDTRVKISEDVKFACDALVKTKRIGLISTERFLYRKRLSETSAIQTSTKKPTFFWDTPKLCFEHILDLCKKHKDMSDYLQFTVAYDLRFRIFDPKLYILNDEERIKYKAIIRELLRRCDDRIIAEQAKVLDMKYLKELDYKYKEPIYKRVDVKDGFFMIDNKRVCEFSNLLLDVYDVYIEKGYLIIKSCLDFCLNNDFDLYYKINDGKYFKFNKKSIRDCSNTLFNDDYDYVVSHFDTSINLTGVNKIDFYLEIKENKYRIKPNYIGASKLNKLKTSYFKKDGFSVTHDDMSIFINQKKHFLLLNYIVELIKKREFLVLGMIFFYYFTYLFIRKNNWIIADREDQAGDNGEEFLKYLKDNKLKRNVYFGLNKNSKDINRISKITKVINFWSIKFYLLYLRSEFVISSHIDNYISMPFGRKQIFLNFILNRKFIYLQHGISIGNLGRFIERPKRKIDLFVASTDIEYKNMISYYTYDDSIIKLTGMPRYDNLCVKENFTEEKIILVCPTWRLSISGPSLPRKQGRPYREDYKTSELYDFYQDLLNNKKLLNYLKKENIKVKFCLHPLVKKQIIDYQSNEFITYEIECDYGKLIKEASLLVTDYSSLAFDFAYLRKPVIYTQFDSNSYYKDHIYFGSTYFDFSRDGFGDITKDVNATVDKIIEILNNECKMEKKYVKRVDKFFKYNDKNNCKRVYSELMKLRK